MRARKMGYLMRPFDARDEEPLTADVRGYGLGKSVDLASRAGFERRARERLPPHEGDSAAVICHVEECPGQLIDGERQRLDLHRHAGNVFVRSVTIGAP